MPLGIVVGCAVQKREADLAFAENAKRSVHRESGTVAGTEGDHPVNS
jgi:hypothetical protein